jgi:diadenylate cyclase
MGQILSYLTNFKLLDAIDIIIVAVIIYRFFLIVQGTRAIQMLIGLAGLIALFGFSLRYELYSLNWLLDQFFEYSIIILMILFQDSIRSGLVSLGGAKLFRSGMSDTNTEIIEEVVEACGALSRERTGAIIIFEKRNGLLNYVNTGTKLDCKIHSDIIYSIFQTKSPLHDGAIIIFENRIQAAGCFLPLSKNVEIDRHLGTRHRAALGITEVSDSVAVTVSEETGKISVCFNRAFHDVKSEVELRKYLRKFIGETSRNLMLDSMKLKNDG